MPEALLDALPLATACAYFGALAAVATWEGFAPRRELEASLRLRWLGHFALAVLDTLVLRLLFPVLAVGFAVVVEQRGVGLLNLLELPAAVAGVLAFLALDAAKYLQHWLLHRVPLLWRLHRVHHTDADYDFTTGLRFHPLESVFTTAFGLAAIAALGAPPVAVALYQLVFITVAIFVHGNVRFPLSVDRVLRRLLVTPEMHRVHHSAVERETNANLGQVLPWWDRLFGSYVDQPTGGHLGMTVGLREFRERRHLTLGWMLLNPFLRSPETATPTQGDPR